MIMAKNSNNNYVNIEDIEAKNNNEYYDIEKIVSKQGNLLYNKYKETEGTLPINFKGKGKDLKNYRIYGNTVDGESVGDRTANLFANLWEKGYIRADNGLEEQVDGFICSGFFPVEYGQTYSISRNINVGYDNIRGYRDDKSFIGAGKEVCNVTNPFPSAATKIGVFTVTNENVAFIRFNDSANDLGMKYMIVDGTYTEQTMPAYEPYGYKVPVTVEGKNLFDMKKFAETAYPQNATVNYSENSLIFTPKNLDAFVNGAFSQTNVAVQFRPSCINVHPLTTYTISMNTPYKCYISWIDDSFNPVDAYTTIPPNQPSYTFTTPSNCTKLHIRLGKYVTNIGDTFTISNVMLNEGSTALPYEPYHAPVTTPIYLPEPLKMVGDEAEYIDYGEQKQHRVRKNLLISSISEIRNTGVEYTVNNDKSITANGSTSSIFSLALVKVYLTKGSYIISGCPQNGSQNTYRCEIRDTVLASLAQDTGAGVTYSIVTDGYYYYSIRIAQNYVCDNLTFYPMIRKADIEDDAYEPYIENTELDVALPALPVLPGTNVLSVGTAVQPSSVYLKGKLKRTIYGWHVDPDISDSSNAVTYLKDAIGMIPASMGSSTFNYGSWQNAFFMPKPCMLKSNGKVDYYLDPNDYTKKLDGTASDISNPNYDGNAMMQWPKIWFKYVKGAKEGQGYFYVANYKADGNFHCWCNYDSEDNEIDHFYTAIYNGTSFANYSSSKTYVINDFAIYDNKLYKCNTDIATAQEFDSAKWNVVSNTAPAINKMRSLSGIRLTGNNGNAQTNTTTEVTRAEANNTTIAKEWYIETFSDRLLINGLLVLMGKSLNTQAAFGRGLDSDASLLAKEAYITGTLNDKGLFYGVIGDGQSNGKSAVKVFGMENFWGCVFHRTAGLITDNHVIKLKLTYGTKDGSTVVGYNQTGNGYIDNGISPFDNGYIQKMSYNKYGFIPAVVTEENQSTYYADYCYEDASYTGISYALFGGSGSGPGSRKGAFSLFQRGDPEYTSRHVAASLSCKPISLFN